jgi:hypothetical protein
MICGCGGSSRSSTTQPAPASTSTSVSTATVVHSTAAAGAHAPAGGPVPPGTKATSVTFVSPDTAFLLGTAPCRRPPCSVILRTRDRGHSWQGLPAPIESVSAPYGNGLWGLRFADPDNGYAYGSGLWQTSNGGLSWRHGTAPAHIVLALAAVQDRELVAVAAPCLPGQEACSQSLGLYHRAIKSTIWTSVAGTRTRLLNASLAVYGADVWALVGPSLYVSTDGGASFTARSQPCGGPGSPHGTATSITTDGVQAYLLCTGGAAAGSTAKYVFSANGVQAPWMLVGRPPLAGDGGELSAGSDRALIIATASGASLLYRSTDGGRRWTTTLTEDDGGAGWADLGFTTATDGVVVHGPATRSGGADGRPGELLLTADGGRRWRTASF